MTPPDPQSLLLPLLVGRPLVHRLRLRRLLELLLHLLGKVLLQLGLAPLIKELVKPIAQLDKSLLHSQQCVRDGRPVRPGNRRLKVPRGNHCDVRRVVCHKLVFHVHLRGTRWGLL